MQLLQFLVLVLFIVSVWTENTNMAENDASHLEDQIELSIESRSADAGKVYIFGSYHEFLRYTITSDQVF